MAWTWAAAIAVVVGGVLALGLLGALLRAWRRKSAARLPDGVVALREAIDVPTRLFVDRTVPGGPKAGVINRRAAWLVLAADRFVLATYDGRVLDLHPGVQATARCTGPRRLVIMGRTAAGRVSLRAELLVADAEAWADAITALVASGPARS